jgi:hypothetical protein
MTIKTVKVTTTEEVEMDIQFPIYVTLNGEEADYVHLMRTDEDGTEIRIYKDEDETSISINKYDDLHGDEENEYLLGKGKFYCDPITFIPYMRK